MSSYDMRKLMEAMKPLPRKTKPQPKNKKISSFSDFTTAMDERGKTDAFIGDWFDDFFPMDGSDPMERYARLKMIYIINYRSNDDIPKLKTEIGDRMKFIDQFYEQK